jgi:hypothetical protein
MFQINFEVTFRVSQARTSTLTPSSFGSHIFSGSCSVCWWTYDVVVNFRPKSTRRTSHIRNELSSGDQSDQVFVLYSFRWADFARPAGTPHKHTDTDTEPCPAALSSTGADKTAFKRPICELFFIGHRSYREPCIWLH